jgi:arylsulfatase A-like enzyme
MEGQMMRRLTRRNFLGMAAAASVALGARPGAAQPERKPNLLFVFADQWRAQALGYAGDPNVKTPHLDRMAARGVNMTNAVSGCPVCSPYRGSLMTGQYPITHGVFMNDVPLPDDRVSFAEVLNGAGYDTGYIGKWHLDGRGRSSFIPPERRQGFQFWMAQECTHDYLNSHYYAGDDPTQKVWEGYDTFAQTDAAIDYMKQDRDKPFALFLSWGPPHNPYETAPEEFHEPYDAEALELPPNVPAESEAVARKELAGYYAHCSALDAAMGRLIAALEENGQWENTLVVFTSDHGDMLGSQGQQRKQRPYDEAIRVPMLLDGGALGVRGRKSDYPMNTVDIMPTMLGLLGVGVPDTVEGDDLSAHIRGAGAPDDAALIACYQPFGEWTRARGGKEYRGLRTERYTYVRDLEGPWLLFDNQEDPYQQHNLIGSEPHAELQSRLDTQLTAKLKKVGDEFLPGKTYVEKWGYPLDDTETVPYKP